MAVRLETRVKLTLVDGGEVTGKLVQVTSDAVKLKEYETGRSGIITPSGASGDGEMAFVRSQVETIEILKAKGARSIAFVDLSARLKPGDQIYVTDTAGHEATGRLVDIGPTAVRVRVRGTEREWAAVDVREVGKRGDVAVFTCRNSMARRDGTPPVEERVTTILVKSNGEWQQVLTQSTIQPPPTN